jgi:anti-sigma-K factor RskA
VYHAVIQGKQLQQQASDVELRLSELQTQIDRLSLALHQWHQSPEYAHLIEDRLAQLLERCADTMNRVSAIEERHTKAVATLESRLSDWSFIETRLEQDSDQRIRQFEQIIGQEWETLRKLHEEPANQLREQAASLGETCVAAANLALRGFERAEARFVALEAGLQDRMNQLARELQSAVADLRSSVGRPAALPDDLSPFPLESVMRIHDEHRRPDESGNPPTADGNPFEAADTGAPRNVSLQLTGMTAPLPGRMDSLEGAQTANEKNEKDEKNDGPDSPARTNRIWGFSRTAVMVAALAVLGVAGLIYWWQRGVQAKLTDAALRVSAAERQTEAVTKLASQRISQTQEDANRRVAEARDASLQAQIVSSVLAAPDLARVNLAGGPGASRAYAQVLWSRSRGFVFSASGVPAPRQGSTYQLWLLTVAGPVSAGVFTPDATGRATLASDTPPNLPRPLVNAVVTLEPSGGRPAPTGDTVLTRAQ